jgi:hypothetical protein
VTDYSKMSDAELLALASPTAAPDYSKMSDEELLAAAQGPQRGVIDKLTGATGPRFQTWPERAVRGLAGTLAGIPERAISAAYSAPPGSREATEAMIGPAADAAMATAGTLGTLRTGVAKAVTPSAEALDASGAAGFDAARDSGVKITASSVNRLADTTMAKLEQLGLDSQLAPDTFHTLAKMRAPAAEGAFADVANIRSMRATLQNAARNFNNPREQKAASMAIRDLDAHLGDLGTADVLAGDPVAASRTLGNATGDWAAKSRSETVTDAARNAELSADAANSEKNIGKITRQKFKSLLLNEKESSGFSPDELAQMERIVSGTKTGNATRSISNLLGGGDLRRIVASSAGAGAGALVGGPAGAVVGGAIPPTLGTIARLLSNRSTANQVRKLDEMVRQRSPLFQSQPVAQEKTQSLPMGLIMQALLDQRQGVR